MPVKVGDVVLVGDRYAMQHYYEEIVGRRLPVIEIRLPGGIRTHTKVVVKDHHKNWFIREEDAMLTPRTNQDGLRLLHTDGS